jgi:catechol 2,3-dioxygenase-like lactoylglutathione lyase family enzyme
MKRNLLQATLSTAALLTLGCALYGQTSQPAAAAPTGIVIGFQNLIHTVADVDKSVAFYRDAFGMEVNGSGPAKTPAENPRIQQMTNTKGAKFRVAAVKIPGADFSLEFTEFTGIPRNPVVSGMGDPGNSMLNLRVRDIDAIVPVLLKAGATVITTGGHVLERKNANNNTSNRAIFLRDPDGFVMELEQFYPEQASAAPAGSRVLTGSIGMTASDADKTAAFWALFGVDVKLGKSNPGNATSMALSATENANFRGNAATIPGTPARWTIFEFKGIPNTPVRRNIPDPGTPAMSLRVRDIDEAMRVVKANRIPVVTAGGEAVKSPSGAGGNVFIRDPDGFIIELIQAAQPAQSASR